MKIQRCLSVLVPVILVGIFALMAALPATAQIQVNSANPSAAPQGTTNLNVTISGNGFKKGATAKWFVTGTTNPGGVTVNSTTFQSSTQLTANITVASNAVISGFDIVVTVATRTGKGTDLFAVLQSNANSCTVQPLPSGISWVTSLNYVAASGAAAYGPNFGVTTRSRQMVLGGVNVLVVGVGTPATTGNLEIFVLNASTGQVLDGTAIGSNTAVQPHITMNLGAGTSGLAVGDVNGDGIPDFLAGSKETNAANGVVGSVDAKGTLSYQAYPLTIPANVSGAGWSGAMGDLQGTGNDVIALGAIGGGTTPGQVLLYEWNGSGFTNYLNIVSPLQNPKGGEEFGHGVAIADVTGGTAQDLIVGAPGSIVSGQSGAGRVLIFSGPVSATNYLSLTTGVKNDGLGTYVAAGDTDGDASADGYMDVLATAAARALGYYGPISGGQSSSLILQAQSKLSAGWSTTQPAIGDINGDGLADVLIGAPNASSQPICGGAAYLWLSSGTPLATEIVLSTPVANAGLYGWATGFGPGTRLFFVSDHYFNIGSTSQAGQVYVYKLN
jgi:hypothetical protein